MGSMDAFHVAIQTGVNTYVEDEPGRAKTAYQYACDRVLNRKTVTLVGSQCDPTDAGGVLVHDPASGVVNRVPVGAWVKEFLTDTTQVVTVFMDEKPNTPPAVSASFLKFTHEGMLGDTILPRERLFFVAAGNNAEHSPIYHEPSAAESNRWCKLQWGLTNMDWLEGFMQSEFPPPPIKVLPPNWKSDYIQSAKGLVGSFLRAKPELIHACPKERSKQAEPWPSWRTWEFTTWCLAACEAINETTDTKLALVAGCVGPGAGVQFIHFCEQLDLPNPEDVLRNPGQFNPKSLRLDQLYATLHSVASAFQRDNSMARWKAICEVIDRTIDSGNSSVAATIAKPVQAKAPAGELGDFLLKFDKELFQKLKQS